MKKTEAIEYIKKNCYGEWCEDDWREAMDMAIEASKCSERTAEITQIDHTVDVSKKVERTAEIAQNVQNEDLISRKAAIEAMMFQEIVVIYSSYNPYPEYQGKLYFSIKYTKNGQEFIGYSTYKPEVLSEYLKEYFMPTAQPEIIRCKDCKHRDKYGCCKYWKGLAMADIPIATDDYDFCSYAELI